MWQHITITRSVDSPCQQFLDLLDQASWCHVGRTRSSWLHRCGMGCHRLWCWGILLTAGMSGTVGACIICVAGVAGAADVGCMHGTDGGNAGCSALKWGLACSVAGVPLGTVLTALTLHSQRCLCMQQYVGPLLVHTR